MKHHLLWTYNNSLNLNSEGLITMWHSLSGLLQGSRLRTLCCGIAALIFISASLPAEEPATVLKPNWWKPVRNYNTTYHPWTPPTSQVEWEKEKTRIRNRILVSQGMWPLQPREDVQAVITKTKEMDDYVVESIYFESRPGLLVTGSLYRPKTLGGPAPGILCPHGHWPNGRFYSSGDAQAKSQIDQGAESDMSAAHHPMQARMVQLARMGCVVFHYDMMGYADHQQFDHRAAFTTCEDGLWLIESMGLQTWNSLRALDYLAKRKDVDAQRLAITGSSGGGTQTMILAAIDDRIVASVPAVMVSTAMQGGCVCENSPYLRIDSNNIAIAAAFAPKPQGLIGADDWTIQLMSRGLPELKQVYGLYGASDRIAAWVHPEFKHNYNQVSRTHMYDWMVTHLGLEASIEERPFQSLSKEELSVFTDQHPVPESASNAEQLRASIIAEKKEIIVDLAQKEHQAVFQEVVKVAADIMLDASIDNSISPLWGESKEVKEGRIQSIVAHPKEGWVVPIQIEGAWPPRSVVTVVVSDQGDQLQENDAKQGLLEDNAGGQYTIVYVGLSGTGSNHPSSAMRPINETYYGYSSCYEHPLLSQQTKELATVIYSLCESFPVSSVNLVGQDDAAIAALLAQSFASDLVAETKVDLSGDVSREITSIQDPLFLPGAKAYGGFGGLAAFAPCSRIVIQGLSAEKRKHYAPLELTCQEFEWAD